MNARLGDYAAATAAGDAAGRAVLASVQRGMSDPDGLARAIARACADDGNPLVPGPALIRLARSIQKHLESEASVR